MTALHLHCVCSVLLCEQSVMAGSSHAADAIGMSSTAQQHSTAGHALASCARIVLSL